MLQIDPQDKARLIDPLFRAGRGFWPVALALGAVCAWGATLYLRQLTVGLAVTGMDRPSYWGIYIVNFIFMIGVSMAGTVITAVLYLTGVNWRRTIARIAEATTVFGLMIAGLQIMVDMGRPDRLLNIFIYGRLQSPLLWDMASLTLYLLTSTFALYLSLMPDMGILRDNLPDRAPAWRRFLYTTLTLGWRGNAEQWRRLERVVKVISILIIPIGISLHTVTSWIFSTTLQPGWNSTILGPYFVVGAIFSGIGLLFIILTLMRAIPGVKPYIETRHYRHLGWLFITMCVVWFYFTYTEHLTMVAGQAEAEMPVLASKLWGADAPAFWAMVILMAMAAYLLTAPLLLPERWLGAIVFRPRIALAAGGAAAVPLALAALPLPQAAVDGLSAAGTHQALVTAGIGLAVVAAISGLAWLRRHVVTGTVVASLAVVVGMWLERWNIIIPTITHPRLIAWTSYTPTLTEWSLTAFFFALFALLLLAFFKLFPAVSLWEVAEGRVIESAQAQVTVPMPPSSAPAREPRWGFRRSLRRGLR